MPTKQIIPAILAKTSAEFARKAKFLESFFSVVQVDVLDGSLVDNRSFFDLRQVRSMGLDLNYELHLMVDDPMEIVRPWLSYSRLERVIFHIESFKGKEVDLYAIIKELKQRKIKIGIALNPKTKLSKLDDFASKINFVLIMGVNPGKSGQRFLPSMLKKIRESKKRFPKLPIAVDGGVTVKNYKKIIKAGATTLNAATMIYQLLPDEIRELKKILKNA